MAFSYQQWVFTRALSKDLKVDRLMPVGTPRSTTSPPWEALRNRPLWGRFDNYSSNDPWSMVMPGPIVVLRLIFFM